MAEDEGSTAGGPAAVVRDFAFVLPVVAATGVGVGVAATRLSVVAATVVGVALGVATAVVAVAAATLARGRRA